MSKNKNSVNKQHLVSGTIGVSHELNEYYTDGFTALAHKKLLKKIKQEKPKELGKCIIAWEGDLVTKPRIIHA